MSSTGRLTCLELVELLTEYLDGALSAPERERAEAHLARCTPCRRYLQQLRLTMQATGRLTEQSISPEAQATLLDAFRDWKRDRPA